MTRRRPAFDPSRLDDIDELLPPAPPPVEQSPGAGAAGSAGSADSPVGDGQEPGEPDTAPPGLRVRGESAPLVGERGRVARGQGGRPPAPRVVEQLDGEPGRVQVAVRIAHTLYEQVTERLLAGPERPSYGQLVVWTCEDHPDAVVGRVVAARPGAGSRRPRGRRLAAESVQVTLRLTLTERSRLDALADRVREIHPGRVTRTEVAAAALRIALDHSS